MERGGGRERGRAPFAHKDVRESGVACTTHPNKVGAVTSGFEVLCHTGHIYGDALEPSDRVLGIVDLWDHVLNVHVWESSNTPIAPQNPPQCQQQAARARAPIQTHRPATSTPDTDEWGLDPSGSHSAMDCKSCARRTDRA